MPALSDILRRDKALVGMIHVGALPGTPHAREPLGAIAIRAADEAKTLEDAGFDALCIENMHDRPYLSGAVGPEIVAGMTAVGLAVRAAAPKTPLGVQVLGAANVEALAVAMAIDGVFIRAENFVFAHVADEGLMPEASAARLLRERRRLGAERIAVFADIKKKHAAHAITADVSLADTARAAEFFSADALVITGSATGEPTSPTDLADVRKATSLPIVVGSGATPETAAELLRLADAIIVGSALKRDGRWLHPIDPDRARAFVRAARR
jgi:membrane complex biogenesis BtpA family protein